MHQKGPVFTLAPVIWAVTQLSLAQPGVDISALTADLRSGTGEIRRQAAAKLVKVSWLSPGDERAKDEAIDALIGALRDKDRLLRVMAAEALGSARSRALVAVPALMDAALDRSPVEPQDRQLALMSRRNALLSIVNMRPEPQEVLSFFLEALEDPEPSMRAYAANGISVVAPAAAETRAALEKATQDPDADVRQAAELGLQTIEQMQ